jgi:hypothetical protein
MSKNFAIAFAVGIGVIAVIVGGVLFMQRGARVGVAGNMLKVRTAPLDENSSVVVIDFRFRNPGEVRFVVRDVKVVMEDSAGNQFEGRTVSEPDAKALFAGMPLLGQKFNTTLVTRDVVAAHEAEDRMVAARFEAPESIIEKRKRFLVRIEDVDGPVSEISEK